jgi:histidinol-phosphate aminotransferase
MIAARPNVEALERYVAPLEGRRGMLRLDFNENTLGPSPKVIEAIRNLPAEAYATYPEYAGLVEAYAARIGLAPDELALFNGADAGIRAIFDAFGEPGSRFVTLRPTFGYYTPCAQIAGMEVSTVPYTADLSFPWVALRAELSLGARICFICNPNNPTSTLVPAEQLLELAQAHPNTLFVIDEIYEPFTRESVLPRATQRGNVLALRTLSKATALAALRIGFVCGSRALVERAFRVTGPYDVNSFAVVAARAALSDPEHERAYLVEVERAKAWTLEQLARLGVRHFHQGGNYLLIWPGRSVEEVEAELRARGILVRSMGKKPLIDGSFRLSVGTLPQMQQFFTVFEALLPASKA